MSAGTATAACRLVRDAWQGESVADLHDLRMFLRETDPDELRSAVQHLATLVLGLAVLLEENQAAFSFDRWLSDQALAGLAGPE